MSKQKIIIVIFSLIAAIGVTIFVVILLPMFQSQNDLIGNWYAWHENGSGWEMEVMTFYDDATYETSSYEGVKNEYSVDKDVIYLEGGEVACQSLILEHQNDQLILKADNGWIYYHTEDAAQGNLTRKTAEELPQQEELLKQEEMIFEDVTFPKEKKVADEKISEDILGNWTNKANVELSFYDDGKYMIIDADRNIEIGSYRLTGSHTMLISNPDVQLEEEIEFVLTVIPYEDGSDQFKLSSQYFEGTGDFYKHQYYDFD